MVTLAEVWFRGTRLEIAAKWVGWCSVLVRMGRTLGRTAREQVKEIFRKQS